MSASARVSDASSRMDLPPQIRRYLERSLPSGDLPEFVRIRQSGEMQLKPGRWTRFEAVQEMALDRVEFSWRARFPLAPLVALHVHDWYRAGEGALEVRLFGLPAMAHNYELEWREVGERTVEVATSVAGARLAVLLHFDDAGDIVAASAKDRPRAGGKTAVETPFAGDLSDYAVFDGVRVPTRAEVRWDLAEGPFVYFRGRITRFELS